VLHREFSAHPEFRLVSISLNPKEDTPEKITKWVKEHDVDLPGWWFLTGDETEIREYMMDWFHLPYGEESDDPAVIAAQGKFQHVPRLVLVDGIADIRGYYQVMRSDIGEQEFERLKSDIRHLFDEIKEAGDDPLPEVDAASRESAPATKSTAVEEDTGNASPAP
jgi:cytochrome oxidase Cu insertion factor (SCO1/SenC/PrrC family)